GFLFQYPRLDVWNAQLQGLNFDNVLGTVDVSQAHYDAAPGTHRAAESEANVPHVAWRLAAWVLAFMALALLARVVRRFGSAYVVQRLAVLALTLLIATLVVFVIVQV